AETPEFQEMLHREFPPGAAEWWDGLSRRSFLKMAAASLALAGLTACTKQPTEEIYPYVKQPEELVLGQPLFYATSMVLGGFATGVLAKSREGHPIKIDGNPDHPAALGGSSIWMQASILDLYDPDRSQSVTHNGELSDWALFLSDLNDLLKEQQTKGGEGLRFLTETVTSPTLAAQIDQLLEKFPKAKWYQYDPITRDNVREGARLAFGEIVEAHYEFEQAAVIVSLDSDFLYIHPERLRHTLGFTNGRRLSGGRREMSRLYVLESTPTVTGTMADHRLPVSSGRIEALAQWLARRLEASAREPATVLNSTQANWLEAVVRDLQQHQGASIIIAGEWQPPRVHALAHALNERLGNVGKTIRYTESAEARPIQQLQSFRELTAELRAGAVDTLFILGGNPVYTAPPDLEFGHLLSRVPRSIHVGLQWDETAALSTWHIPQTHYLESWGDARSFDGTISLQQPLIAPLYSGKSVCEVLGAMMQQQPVRSDFEILRDFWQSQKRWPDFDQGWRKALHDGFIEGTQAEERNVQLKSNWEQAANSRSEQAGTDAGAEESPASQRSGQGGAGDASEEAQAARGSGVAADRNVRAPEQGGAMVETSTPPSTAADKRSPFSISPPKEVEIQNLEICFRPDPNLWDGRFANNGWLQECPRPVNKLTWDNAVLVSPALAERSGLTTNDVVEVNFRGQKLRGPVWVMPGQAENSITLHLGYGRSRVGRVGGGVGFNAYRLRLAETAWTGMGASLVKTGKKHSLVATQTHHHLGSPERQVYRAATLEEFLAHPDVVKKSVESPETEETLYYPDEYKYEGYKWGMSIDL
ncbi:MAG TPA: TAT-variant-translocated molybdopterin oxidoreductase, partial [Bacillota bacterium]|nr:TAT-variant-translocated molybdopterin oxidoreductase [Bacillota bacterium]